VLTGVPVYAGVIGELARAALGAVAGGIAVACAEGVVAAGGADVAGVTPPGVPVPSMVPMITAAVSATAAPRPIQIGARLLRFGTRMDATTRCAGSDATASATAERSRRRPSMPEWWAGNPSRGFLLDRLAEHSGYGVLGWSNKIGYIASWITNRLQSRISRGFRSLRRLRQ
jgi:hypothetical protein